MRQIRGLVEQNVLRAAAEYRFGLSKLLPAADVQRFAEIHVATSVLAKRFRLNSGAFARYLKESGTPLLVVPLSDRGKGHAFFLRKGCGSSDSDSQPQDTERARTAPYRGRSEAALGRAPASEGNGLGQTHSTSPSEA